MMIWECSLCRNSDNNWKNQKLYFGKSYTIIRLKHACKAALKYGVNGKEEMKQKVILTRKGKVLCGTSVLWSLEIDLKSINAAPFFGNIFFLDQCNSEKKMVPTRKYLQSFLIRFVCFHGIAKNLAVFSSGSPPNQLTLLTLFSYWIACAGFKEF